MFAREKPVKSKELTRGCFALYSRDGAYPLAKLLIALWSYPSSSCYGSDWKSVVGSFRQRVKDTFTELGKYTAALEKGNGFQAIFAAPEYIFVGRDSLTKKRIPMQASEKDDLLRDLKAISLDYKPILIFAGTVFYREETQSDTNFKKFNSNLVAAQLAARNRGYEDVIVKTGWNPNGVNVPSLNEVAQKKTATSYRAYNSAYPFLGGDVLTPYNKEFDCKETEGADAATLLYVPGSSGGTRDIKNFDFAIEVCADHVSGALRGKDGDFHVVVSDWAKTETANMVNKAGGYFLHASSEPTQTCVYGGPNPKLRLTTTDGATPTSGSLKFWLVEVVQRKIDPPKATVVAGSNIQTVTTSTGKKIQGVKVI
jgi:hypothetical protein